MPQSIYGILGLNESDRQFVNTIGQRIVWEGAQQWMQEFNAELDVAMTVFVAETTTEFKRRYKLPANGRMQRRGKQGRPAAVQNSGEWDVAFPIEDFGDQVAGNDVDLAYMTIQEFQNHLDGIQIRATNTFRYEMLKRIFNGTQVTHLDQTGRGTLLVEGLANGDAVYYPPLLGTENAVTGHTHYLEAGYAGNAISDTNNPIKTIVNELQHHFGERSGGENIVVFIHTDEEEEVRALGDFTAVNDNFIRTGANVDIPVNLPMVPGKIIGRCNGAWISIWRWMPDNYMLGLHLEEDAPLIQRIDEPGTGLGQGLQLVGEHDLFPFNQAFYRYRFGLGAGNRLNGVVMELANGGTYTIPTDYQN